MPGFAIRSSSRAGSLFQSSANKIDDDEVENGVGKEEISKRPLWGNALELALVLGVDLDPQANAQDEAADGRDEAAEEGVEGEGADAEAVSELQRAGEQHVEQEGVQRLEAPGVEVLFI